MTYNEVPVGFDERLVTYLVFKVHSKGLYPIAAGVCCWDAWQIAENMQDSSLVGWLFEIFTAFRTNIRCFVEKSLWLNLLAVGLLGHHSGVHALCACVLAANVVTVTWLLNDVPFLHLAGTRSSHLDFLIAYVIVVLVSLHLIWLVSLTWYSRCLGLRGQFGRVLVSVHQRVL